MEKADVLHCQFSSWYSQLKNSTFQSKVIDLSSDVVDYMLADGLALPEGCEDNLQRKGLEGDSDDEVEWDSEVSEAKGPDFPELNEQMKNAIKALGGTVFPKLNWSAPKDAAWIAMENNLKCTCPRDIYLLLKSSDFISHDLTQPFDKCVDSSGDSDTVLYQLVLRRWHNINPSGEFRCFVKNKKLIGISQRQHTAYFPNIPADKNKICRDVINFHKECIQGRFTLSNYVFDIYREEESQIYLLDFNPYGPVTDGLLFTWDELFSDKPLNIDVSSDADFISHNVQSVTIISKQGMSKKEFIDIHKPIFRCVESEGHIQSNPHQCYAMPQDFVHLCSGEDPNKLIDFLKMRKQDQGESSTDED